MTRILEKLNLESSDVGERKFKFRKPGTEAEHLEAIYEEMSCSPREVNFQPTETVKDHLVAILDHGKSVRREREREKEGASYAVTWALGVLAAASIVFAVNGFGSPGDWEWLNENRFAIRLWGIAFAAIFLGVSIERSSFFRSLWTFGFTKLVASIAVSGLLVFSTGKASSLINAVFSIDASALPFTRAIVTGLLMFEYAYPLLFVVALLAALHMLHFVNWIADKFLKNEHYAPPPMQSIVFPILALIALGFSARWVGTDFSDELWQKKVYRLAHVLDFNTKYPCANLRQDLSVVFIGPEQSRVMVDTGRVQTSDMKTFVDAEASENIMVPAHFPVVPCELALPRQ